MSSTPRRIAASTAAATNARRQRAPAAPPGHATLLTASYDQLVCSKLNVRRKGGDDLRELTALIRSQGLLQNLIGFPQTEHGMPTGRIEIVAGRRRLACIGALIASGDYPHDFQIPYLLIAEHEAVAVSLAENAGREAMHPADVFEAMQALATRGAAVIDIAAAFGVDALTVKRRLKLANVAPRFLRMYRNDTISYEQMAALAISDSHAAQEQAWDRLDSWSRQPQRLRRLLTTGRIDVRADRLAGFIDMGDFIKAGGVIERDLFSDVGAGFIRDVALLERLAMDKLADAAKQLDGEGHAWLALRLHVDAKELATYGRARTVTRRATPEEQIALDGIAEALADLERTIKEEREADREDKDAHEDDGDGEGEGEGDEHGDNHGDRDADHGQAHTPDWDDGRHAERRRVPRIRSALDRDEDEADMLERMYHRANGHTPPCVIEARCVRIAELEEQQRALLESFTTSHPDDRARAGTIVTIDQWSMLAILRGMIRPEDKQRPGTPSEGAGAEGGARGTATDRAVHSERLVTLLTAHRTVALHAEMMAQPSVALAILVHALILDVFGSRLGADPAGLARISLARPSLPYEVEAGPAWHAVAARRAQLAAQLHAALGLGAGAGVGVGVGDPLTVDAAAGTEADWEVEGGRVACGGEACGGESGAPRPAPPSLLAWLLQQPQATLLDYLAFCVGASLDCIQAREAAPPSSSTSFQTLAHVLGLDMRRWWQATAANYFTHVAKARIVEVVASAHSPAAAAPLEALRKVAAADAAARLVADTGWLPDVLRTDAAPTPQALETPQLPQARQAT